MSTPAKPGYREFPCTIGDKTVNLLSVRHPSKAELEAADLEYSGVFNQSLLAGLPTQAKMLRSLRENGVIDAKDEAEIGQLMEDVRDLDKQLTDLKKQTPADDKKVEHDKTIVEVQAQRFAKSNRLGQLNREIEAMLAHTADSKAMDAQRNFLIACVAEHADGTKKGSRVWDDVDKLNAETDMSLVNRVVYAHMMCQSNQPDEWETLMVSLNPPEPKTDDKGGEGQTDEAKAKLADAVADSLPKVITP